MLRDQRRGVIEEVVDLRQFVRLDQPQVPRRQLEPGIAGQAAQNGLGKAVVAGASLPPDFLSRSSTTKRASRVSAG